MVVAKVLSECIKLPENAAAAAAAVGLRYAAEIGNASLRGNAHSCGLSCPQELTTGMLARVPALLQIMGCDKIKENTSLFSTRWENKLVFTAEEAILLERVCWLQAIYQGPGMKPRTGSTKIKIAETVGIIHLYPHMKVSRSFGDNFSGASSPRFHPRALI